MLAIILFASAQIAPAGASDADTVPDDIVVTASLSPVSRQDAPASVTRFDAERIEALGSTFASDLLRLAPGMSVSVSGAPGGQTQVRIRGAEANHTLLFIDGIAFNDVAANNEARFETVTASGLGRLELIRGPQSALWGSEALGGVVAIETPDPLGAPAATVSAEYGSRDFVRASAAVTTGGESRGLSATASYLRSDGIDVLGGGTGDLDGFANLTSSLKAVARRGEVEAGAVGRYVRHRNAYDGTVLFRRADTAHASAAETHAERLWLRYGLDQASPWSAKLEVQRLDSENRNRLAEVRTNDSYGRRLRYGGQLSRRFPLAGGRHELVFAAEREKEEFGTRDLRSGGASDRDLDRSRTAFVGEWRASWGTRLVTDIAVRHDDFGRFEDETSLRANAVLNLSPGLALLVGYGEGIAQPTFVDLFGFGADSDFIGNPDLRPERSRGFEAGLRWSGAHFALEAVAFSNALEDEIVEDFSPFPSYTVVNAPGRSRRRGIELSAEWRPMETLRFAANATFLDSRERKDAEIDRLREIRRPRRTANLVADWQDGPLSLGASLAYVGKRIDSDFDLFPAPRVTLKDHVLGSARFGYRLTEAIEAFARVENGFDARYRDVVGYATQGRSAYAGLRFLLGR